MFFASFIEGDCKGYLDSLGYIPHEQMMPRIICDLTPTNAPSIGSRLLPVVLLQGWVFVTIVSSWVLMSIVITNHFGIMLVFLFSFVSLCICMLLLFLLLYFCSSFVFLLFFHLFFFCIYLLFFASFFLFLFGSSCAIF